MLYLALKHLHLTTVVLSFALFAARGVWMLRDAVWLQRRWVRVAPHVVDSVLLVSAIGMMLILQQYPFLNSWLTAKFFALLLYITLGSMALRYGKTKRVRAVAWLAALATFGYIASVGVTHTPLGFWQWLGDL